MRHFPTPPRSRRARLAAVLLAGVWFAASAGGAVLHVYVLAGQSNAAGAGNGDELPADYRPPPGRVWLFPGGDSATPSWGPLAPYPRVDAKKGIARCAFGVEIAFGHAMRRAHPDRAIGIVKQSHGGASVVAWDPDHERPDWRADMAAVRNPHVPPQHPVLVRTVRDALAAAARLPGIERAELAGLLWVQVERDCTSGEAQARAFPRRLAALIANLRETFGAPELPVVALGPHNGAHRELVRTGLVALADSDPWLRVVPSADLPTHEGIHFDTAGQLELGRRYAAAMMPMVKGAR